MYSLINIKDMFGHYIINGFSLHLNYISEKVQIHNLFQTRSNWHFLTLSIVSSYLTCLQNSVYLFYLQFQNVTISHNKFLCTKMYLWAKRASKTWSCPKKCGAALMWCFWFRACIQIGLSALSIGFLFPGWDLLWTLAG